MNRTKSATRRRRGRGSAPSRYEELLDTATRLFAQLGYERTTVRIIGSELGIESGSLYTHIQTKDQMLRDIVIRIANLFFERAEAAVTESGSAEDRLRALGRAHLGILDEQRDAVWVYYENWRKLEGSYYREIVSLRKRYEEIFAEVVQDGIESGEFKPVDAKWVVVVLLSSLNWVPQWYSPNGPLSASDIADSLLNVLLTGVRTTNDSSTASRTNSRRPKR
jgi:AcrR family transcriptional regulator